MQCPQTGDLGALRSCRFRRILKAKELVEPVVSEAVPRTRPASFLCGWRRFAWLANAEQVDHEDQGLAAQLVTAAGWAVSQFRRNSELAATADLHAGDPLLPSSDQIGQREGDRLAAAPRGVELFAIVEADAKVVNLDGCSGRSLRAIADNDVRDLKRGWCRALWGVDFWL